ncbi:MAG: hypothetical protein Q7K21_05970, partial [Elusimicrobiota bacterium]|nr:hypothetical protein [Elusimicrobiota bacterium]
MTNTWKDYLLKSSIPLEFEVKKFLDSRGCICDFEYSYLRLDENSIPKEFSYDIDASYIRDEHFVELMIECKYRHQSTKWVFIPEKYGGYQEVYPNSFMHPNDHFCRKKKFRYSSSFPIELASLCIKGIEINTSGHDTKSISHAVSQLSYAFSQKVVSGMEHQIEQLLGSSDFIFYNVPVIVTTASLFRLKNDVSISAIQKSKELSE